jgi:hypothetical protein
MCLSLVNIFFANDYCQVIVTDGTLVEIPFAVVALPEGIIVVVINNRQAAISQFPVKGWTKILAAINPNKIKLLAFYCAEQLSVNSSLK